MQKKFFVLPVLSLILLQIVLAQCVQEGEQIFLEKNTTKVRLDNITSNCCEGLYMVHGKIQYGNSPFRFDHYYFCHKKTGPSEQTVRLIEFAFVLFIILLVISIGALSTIASLMILSADEKETGKNLFLRYILDPRLSLGVGVQLFSSILSNTKYCDDKSFKSIIILLRIGWLLFLLIFIIKIFTSI
jgi:hypothetical protein